MLRNPIPENSVGIGLRAEHYREVTSGTTEVEWFEVHSENYFGQGGAPHYYLSKARENHPISFHGVGLSLGSTDPLNVTHLSRLKELVDIYQPFLVSEHLSWSSVGGVFLHDLLPLPMNEETIQHLVERISKVQDFLGHQILVENASTYLEFEHSHIPEWEFIGEIAKRADCKVLCDVNNIFVNACNHSFDGIDFIDNLPADVVAEIHLAGHTVKAVDDSVIRIDTHNQRVCDEVWELYRLASKKFTQAPTLIEWDKDLPPFQTLLEEANIARTIRSQIHDEPE